jgi:universal stress protein E
MMPLKKALVVLDKPKHAQDALRRAVELQQRGELELELVSFCWNAMCEAHEVFDVHQRRALKKEILRARESWLFDLLRDQKLTAADLTAHVVWTRDIADWVADAVPEHDIDLVLKSVHHSRTLLHTPLDWSLIRRSPAPVLSVAARGRGRGPKPGADVLATIDLRHGDRRHRTMNLRVLDAAQHFAERTGGKLHCVSVVEYSEVLRDLDFIDTRRLRREVIAETSELLEALTAPYGIARARIHRPTGKVGQLVAATARKINAGLVVVGSASRRAAGVELLGGSAERIIERAPCDVLTVHP